MLILNFSAPVSLREKLIIPKESPEKGLSFGIISFSLRDAGAEKLKVKEPNVRRRSEQIGLGGRILEQSSIWAQLVWFT